MLQNCLRCGRSHEFRSEVSVVCFLILEKTPEASIKLEYLSPRDARFLFSPQV